MFSFLLDVFIPRSRIGGSLSNSVFYQWNNCQTLFQNICSILHSHQQCTKVLISAHPYCLFVYSHSRGWSDILLWFWFAFPWWLMMFSIFSCTCPLVYLLWRDDCSILCPFLNWVICFLVELQASLYVFWIHALYQIYVLQIFPPILWVIFSLSWWCFGKHKSLKFREFPVQFICFLLSCVFVLHVRNHCLLQRHKYFIFYCILKVFKITFIS